MDAGLARCLGCWPKWPEPVLPAKRMARRLAAGLERVILMVTTEHMRLTYSLAVCPGKVNLDGV